MSKILSPGVFLEDDGTLLLVRCPKCGQKTTPQMSPLVSALGADSMPEL